METTTTTGVNSPPPAVSANGAAPPPPSTNTTPPVTQGSDWTTGLNDDLKGYVQNKGFKAPQDVLEAYRNYEKLQGVPQDRLLKLPEDLSSPEARAVWERLGAPKEAKEYGLQPKEGDKTFGEWAEKTFFENNVPSSMAKKISDAFNAFQQEAGKKAEDTHKAAMTQAQGELKTKWGTAFEQNVNMVNQGAVALGMSSEEVAGLGAAIGPVKASELLLKLATATGEHGFVPGSGPGGNRVLAPDSAKAKINELSSNTEFVKRLNTGDAGAKKEWDLAHQMAYPGMQSL